MKNGYLWHKTTVEGSVAAGKVVHNEGNKESERNRFHGETESAKEKKI